MIQDIGVVSCPSWKLRQRTVDSRMLFSLYSCSHLDMWRFRPNPSRKGCLAVSRSPAFLLASMLALCLFSESSVRADLISWSYQFPESTSLAADNFAPGRINITAAPSGSVSSAPNSPVTLVASYVTYESSAPSTNPVYFSNGGYVSELYLRDTASQQWGKVVFSGLFDGSLSNDTVLMSHTFTGSTETSLILGMHRYTVEIGPYVPSPSAYATSSSPGKIEVTVTASDLPPQQTPEPSSLFLAALAIPAFGLISRRCTGP